MTEKKRVQGLTHDPIDTDDNFVIDDTTNPTAFDDTPADAARRTKDHNDQGQAPNTQRGTDKQGRAADSTIKPRNNRIFGAD